MTNNKHNKETMKRIIRLTESDLTRIVKRVISEQNNYDPKVTSTQCINSTDKKIVIDNFNGLIKKGFKCVGRKYKKATEGGKSIPSTPSTPETDDIYVKKEIMCGTTKKTLFINIATKPFSELTEVGDLQYYARGFGEGDTTLQSVDGLIKKIEDSCK